jgi:hypothetical protein
MKRIVPAFILVLSILSTSVPVMAEEADDTAEPVLISANLWDYADTEGCWCSGSVEKYGYPEIFANDEGNFYPGEDITRMEFVRLLHRAMDINISYFAPTDIKDYFDDVSNGDIGSGDLYDLVTLGVIDSTGSFKPEDKLDRDEMIHYLLNALDYMTGGDYAYIMLMPEPFNDDADVNALYKNAVYKAVVMDLIHGRGNNMLFPREGTTRAEAVTVIDRLMTVSASLMPSVSVSAMAREAGGGLVMTLTIQNNIDETVHINHSSGQKYDFAIYDSEGESLYRWSADKSFIAALTTTEIGPGEKVEFSESIDGGVYGPIRDEAASIRAYITGTSDYLEINPDGYEARTAIG